MKIICPSCHYVGESKAIAKGSRKIEITLWCCFVLPGMLYTMWRQSRDGPIPGVSTVPRNERSADNKKSMESI